jgi:hypothetical protein
MKTQPITVLAGVLLCTPIVIASENKSAATPDRISVFKAPLVCPAAPQIGCGSASKRILLDLERQPGVLEAWLNRAGTRIAIVWKADADTATRREVVTDLNEDRVTELDGKPRDEAVTDFLSGKGWYHAAEVDRLSDEEAGIIAARLVRRVQAKTPLTQDKAERLERTLADACRKRFVEKTQDEGISVRQLAGDFLDEKQLAALKEAVNAGVRPLPNEN